MTNRLIVEEKKPPSKLSHAVKAAPLNTLSATVHREIQQYEDENVGLEAAHRAEIGAESAARLTESAIRSQRLRSSRKAEAEPSASNPRSRWQQRKAIREEYAAAKAGRDTKNAKQAAEATGKAAEKVKEAAKKAADFVRRHKKGFLIAGGIVLLLAFMLNMFSSCSVILSFICSAPHRPTSTTPVSTMLLSLPVFRFSSSVLSWAALSAQTAIQNTLCSSRWLAAS